MIAFEIVASSPFVYYPGGENFVHPKKQTYTTNVADKKIESSWISRFIIIPERGRDGNEYTCLFIFLILFSPMVETDKN